jgi:hypothetical protein
VMILRRLLRLLVLAFLGRLWSLFLIIYVEMLNLENGV